MGKKRKHDVSFRLQDDVNNGFETPSANVEGKDHHDPSAASGIAKRLKPDAAPSIQHGEFCDATSGNRFKGKSLNKIYILEVFAGSARLSKAAIEHGFASVAIDHKGDRSCGVAIQQYDLTDPSHVESLMVFIEENRDDICMVWMAPPCGTASKARERPLKRLEKLGMKIPKPLRSTAQPDQLDGLKGLDKIKTEAANILYEAVATIATRCYELSIFVVIENPGNSHFWSTSPLKRVQDSCEGHFVSFHNCCHGGDRDKLTSLWVTEHWLDDLESRCDKQHSHKAWTPVQEGKHVRFPTSEEAAYPFVLCSRIVSKLANVLVKLGAKITETLEEQLQDKLDAQTDRLILGALPRGRKIKPLVAEYGTYKFAVLDPQRPSDSEALLATLPKGAKITSRRIITGERGRDEFLQRHSTDILGQVFHGDVVEICTFGIPSRPLEFLERAVRAGHPKSLENYVDQTVHEVAMDNFHLPPHLVAKKRIEFFRKWSARAKELSEDEINFKRKLEPHAANILQGKRLLVLQEILQSIDYPDKDLVKDMSSGFPLSGWMPKSNVFPTVVRRPSFNIETLRRLALGLNRATLKSLQSRQEEELERGAWEETMKEIQQGWLWEASDVDINRCAVAKRFGIRQGPKIRVIDDCSCCGLNGCVGLREKFRLQSIDQLASMIAHSFNIKCKDHPRMLGRTYDLKSAYKQFPLSAFDRQLLRIAVNSPDRSGPKLMGANVLPFGAVGSVAAFLRVSVAVWYIGLRRLSIYWSAFYDDFSVITSASLSNSTAWSCESLFKLLGLKFAEDGSKCQPFSSSFKMLGVMVNLEGSEQGSITIGHTAERSAELAECLESHLTSGHISSKEAERLRGRMIFFERFSFGRVASSAVKSLGKCVELRRNVVDLDEELRFSFEFLKHRVGSSKPITIGPKLHQPWIIFSDGSSEPAARTGAIGGVLVDPCGMCQHFFSADIPPFCMDKLLDESGNPIYELEILPLVVCLDLWGDLIRGCPVVHYIDNDAAKSAMIKGYGATDVAGKLVQEYLELEEHLQLKVWFSRVPSFSNLSDGPSRNDCSEVLSLGASRTIFEWEKFARLLQ